MWHLAAIPPGSVRGLVNSLNSGALHHTTLPPALSVLLWSSLLWQALRSEVVGGNACARRRLCRWGRCWTLRWLLAGLKRYVALISPQTRDQSLAGSGQAG